LENDKIYQLEIFLICSEIIYACSGISNSTTKTWYLFMDCDKWLTSKEFLNSQPWSQTNRQRFSTCGPPVGHRLRTAVLRCLYLTPTFPKKTVPVFV